jgi:uncharacterized protein YndB with AHSA1/START domain
LTKPEHSRNWARRSPQKTTSCEIDLRVAGNYHYAFGTEDGTVCSSRGTYLEIDPPLWTVETWLFNGWPDAEAVETMQLHETDGVTTLTMSQAFRDEAGRGHLTQAMADQGATNGLQAGFDAMEHILRSLLGLTGTVAG